MLRINLRTLSLSLLPKLEPADIILFFSLYVITVVMADGRSGSEYPDTLQGFGYGFNKDGQLRKLHPDTNELGEEGFEFNVANDQEKNQRHYEALGEVITKYVYELLETEGQLLRLEVPMSDDKVKSSDGDKNIKSFIFVSKDALSNSERLLILIHGSGVVRAGQWARSLIINDSLKTGSQLPYIHRARELGYGIMVLNTNDNSRTIEGRHYKIKNSEDPHKHAQYVWENYVKKAKARHLAIVAHSYGGSVVMELIKQFFDEFRKRVVAVAFTDSTHFMSRPNPKMMYYLQKLLCEGSPSSSAAAAADFLVQFIVIHLANVELASCFASGNICSFIEHVFLSSCFAICSRGVEPKVARNWVSSSAPLDTAEETSSKDVPRVSAGTPVHEVTSSSCLASAFAFLEERLAAADAADIETATEALDVDVPAWRRALARLLRR